MLEGKIAVVTGASRGIGKGIAIALGEAHATVYVTGRAHNPADRHRPGSIAETAAAVGSGGGRGIAVQCDHGDDSQVRALFERVRRDHGRLDLLVNNASAFGDTADGYPLDAVPFWESPVALWDAMHRVGLRSHYVASALGAPLMIEARRGLIVNISSAGASSYVFNAAYGAAKAALDKLTADMAHELRAHGIAVISLWPPFTRTEKYVAKLDEASLGRAKSPLFTGRAVAALASDPEVMAKSGRAVRVVDLATEYGFSD